MTLTKYGFKEWFGGAVIALILIGIGVFLFRYEAVQWLAWVIIGLSVVGWLCLAAFFRNPRRTIPGDENVMVSPADGVVRDIEVLDSCEFSEFKDLRVVRIGIFLSVLNVHVNRAPCAMTVTSKHYREGRYLDARSPECSKENEAMTIVGHGTVGKQVFPVAVRQISGAIARRIVCPAEPGRQMVKGDIYGMIKFGSRTELYFPESADMKICVNIGEAVSGGSTILCRLRDHN
jgi:phosphatidylserine decarboxylase